MRSSGDVYRSLAPAVLGYLRAQGVQEPEDVTGEVFLQVARDIHRFEGDNDALRRWVFTIAHHRMVDSHRRRVRRPIASDSELPDRAAPPPAEPLDPALVEALSTLTEAQREVVVLRFIADLPVEAVAKLTGRAEGAVKAMQHRALEQLSRRLAVSRQTLRALTDADE
jgi:RNA polymerase sigma factor (sigma-70 family)